jgi:hypothetical protein
LGQVWPDTTAAVMAQNHAKARTSPSIRGDGYVSFEFRKEYRYASPMIGTRSPATDDNRSPAKRKNSFRSTAKNQKAEKQF